MLKKTIKFEDLDGNMIEEEFYFNLSKAEIAELELSRRDGMQQYLEAIVKTGDSAMILENFKKIIAMTVGVRSEDGKRFIKSDEIRDAFMQTNAYSELFMEMMTVPNAASDFVNAVVPSGMSSLQKTEEKKYTHEELVALPQAEFDQVAGKDIKKMSHEHLQAAFERKSNTAHQASA